MKSNLMIEMYENAYRRAWLELRKKERKDKREQRNSYQSYKIINDLDVKEEPEIILELSEKAKKVNLLLKKGLTPRECGQVLSCSRQAVVQVKSRYGLPR